MPLIIRCDACKRKLKVMEQMAGKVIKCPSCGGKTKVAEISQEAPAQPAPAKEAGPTADEPETTSPEKETSTIPPPASPGTSQALEVPSSPQESGFPSGLLFLAAIPLGVGPLAWFLGNNLLVWSITGLVFALVGMVIARKEDLEEGLRTKVVVGLALAGYLALVGSQFSGGSDSWPAWKSFSGPGDVFTVDFPGSPQQNVEPGPNPGDSAFIYKVERGGKKFEVMLTLCNKALENPGLKLAEPDLPLFLGGKVAKSEDIPPKPFLGRYFVVEEIPQGTMHVKFFVAEKAFYRVAAVSIQDPGMLARFFDSLKIR